jgi:hypothetical protein
LRQSVASWQDVNNSLGEGIPEGIEAMVRRLEHWPTDQKPKQRKAYAAKLYHWRMKIQDDEFSKFYQEMLDDKEVIEGIDINGKFYSF